MTDLLNALAADAEPEDREGIAPSSIAALGERLVALKGEVQRAEADVKLLKNERDQIAKEVLPDAMRAAGLVGDNGKGSFTLADGTKVHLRTNMYASYIKAKQVAFFAWLVANGHGELIKETVNAQTLKAFIREQREEGNDIPQDLVTVHDEVVAVAVKS